MSVVTETTLTHVHALRSSSRPQDKGSVWLRERTCAKGRRWSRMQHGIFSICASQVWPVRHLV